MGKQKKRKKIISETGGKVTQRASEKPFGILAGEKNKFNSHITGFGGILVLSVRNQSERTHLCTWLNFALFERLLLSLIVFLQPTKSCDTLAINTSIFKLICSTIFFPKKFVNFFELWVYELCVFYLYFPQNIFCKHLPCSEMY